MFTIKKYAKGKGFHVGENPCKMWYKILLKDISPTIIAGNMASLIGMAKDSMFKVLKVHVCKPIDEV
jgi:hypothetical protein